MLKFYTNYSERLRAALAGLMIVLCANAEPLHADAKECCPPAEAPEVCCGGETYNPDNSESLSRSFTLSTLNQAISGKVNGTGCSLVPITVNATIEGEKSQVCCDDEIEDKHSLAGEIDIDLGGFNCSYNFLGSSLPEFIASAELFVELKFAFVANNLEFSTNCDGGQVCKTVQGLSASIEGGGEFNLASDFIKCCVSIIGQIDGGLTFCYDINSGTSAKDPTVSAQVNAQFTFSSKVGGIVYKKIHKII